MYATITKLSALHSQQQGLYSGILSFRFFCNFSAGKFFFLFWICIRYLFSKLNQTGIVTDNFCDITAVYFSISVDILHNDSRIKVNLVLINEL